MGGGLGFKRLEAVERGLPRHHHAELSLIFIRAGRAEAWIEGGSAAACAGDLLVFPAGCVHACRPLPGNPLSYDAYFSDELADLAPAALRDALVHEGGIFRLGEEAVGEAVVKEGAADESAPPGTALRLLAGLLEGEGLAGAYRPLRHRPRGSRRSPASVEAVFESLRVRAERPRSLEELAADSGYSAKGLIRAFKRRYGMTPYACLVNGRVNLAQRLIARGEPLAEAALAAGFCDQSHLTRQFRAWTGMSPARFRRLSSKTARVQPR